MKKSLAFPVLALAALSLIELGSSYVIFRYYAHGEKSVRPDGLAVGMLLYGAINRLSGQHPAPTMSIDHGPLFESSDLLGYTAVPGRYRVREELHNQSHVFDLTITPQRHRAAAYLPVQCARRIFMVGDSLMFGWGLDDEETMPWLMQARLPGYQVVNLSLTSYSTVQALLELRQMDPPVGPDDVVVIEYHQLSNKLNVQSPDSLTSLAAGFEMKLGDTAHMREIRLPYGALDERGRLSIHRVSLACAHDPARPECPRLAFDPGAAMKVTQAAFDAIIALHPGHVVIAFFSGPDHDPVIEYLRARGVTVADLRADGDSIPLEDDVVSTDGHMGPFRQHELASRFFEFMQQNRIFQPVP
jgi:hypothetical protein